MTPAPGIRRRLIDYLPAICRRSPDLAGFLGAFDAVLFGPEPGEEAEGTPWSLERLVGGIPSLFDPEETREEFLPWLAQWAAVSAFETVPQARRREVIRRMIPLYGIRGTGAYVEQVLRLYTGVHSEVEEEDLPGMRVGLASTVGQDTRLGPDPFRFHVRLDLASVPGAKERLSELMELSGAVVNLAKPAHTHFRLSHNLAEEPRGLVIYYRSTLGVDTLL
jgi:phage tail-like protein